MLVLPTFTFLANALWGILLGLESDSETPPQECELKLEDKATGELFAACPVEHYPGGSVEAVTDSSRYFVICIKVRK